MYYQIFHTFMGDFFALESKGKITILHQNLSLLPPNAKLCTTALLEKSINEVDCYLRGELKEFSLPFALSGSKFEREVYQALLGVRYGEITTYQSLALAINSPHSCRAIGNALAKNPLLLLIPCHRVICKNGKLGGYVLGEEKKRKILEIEGYLS